MKRIFGVLFLIGCCSVFSRQVSAQSVYVTTWAGQVDFGGGNVQIVGTATATLDYSSTSWYCVDGWAYLYRGGSHLGSGYASNGCQENYTLVQAEVLVPDDVPNAEYVVDAEFSTAPYYTGSTADYYNFYGTYVNPPYIFDDLAYGFYGPGPPQPNYGSVLLGTIYSIFQRGNPALNPGRCGDIRDTIRTEYVTHHVPFYPACSDFTQTRSGQYFSFNELNSGDYAWALIRDPLVVSDLNDGLNRWRWWYNEPRICNSCYRNPARNFHPSVDGVRLSRHMWGDAADLRNESGTVAEWSWMEETARLSGAYFVEPLADSGIGHVHADWRTTPGDYQP